MALSGACVHVGPVRPPPAALARPFVYRESVEDGRLARAKLSGAIYLEGKGLTLPPGSARRRVGEAQTSVIETPFPFTELTPSFEAFTPPGTWVEVETRVRVDGQWLPPVPTGPWTSARDGFPAHRRSADFADAPSLSLAVDTLQLAHPATAFQLTVRLHAQGTHKAPRVRALTAAMTSAGPVDLFRPGTQAADGKVLDVPPRSQRAFPQGAAWCSPTSLSMVMAYFSRRLQRPALDVSVPETAAAVEDGRDGINGNWTFNTAFASSADGGALHAAVVRLSGLDAVEELVAAGLPVIIGLAFGPGELTGAPMVSSRGHLLVVKGFTQTGDVVVNEPNAPSEASVERVYRRDQLARAWTSSRGTAYLLWPAASPTPKLFDLPTSP